MEFNPTYLILLGISYISILIGSIVAQLIRFKVSKKPKDKVDKVYILSSLTISLIVSCIVAAIATLVMMYFKVSF